MGHVATFDHTADVGLRIIGDDLDDLFRTAAEAVSDYIVANRAEVRPEEVSPVTIEAEDRAELLTAWLNELLFLGETTHTLFSRFEVTVSHDGRRLDARVFGEKIDPDRHILDHEVKAVTQHGLSVVEIEGKWVAELILDI